MGGARVTTRGGWRGRYRGKGREPEGGALEFEGEGGGGEEEADEEEDRVAHGSRERPPSRRGRRPSTGVAREDGSPPDVAAGNLPWRRGVTAAASRGWGDAQANASPSTTALARGGPVGGVPAFDARAFNEHLKALADRAVDATRCISELERALSLSEESAAVAVAGVARAQAEMGFMAERVRTLTQAASLAEEERDGALRDLQAAQVTVQARNNEIWRLRGETVGAMGWEEAGKLEAELEGALQRVRAEQKRMVERELRQKAELEEDLGKSINRLRVNRAGGADPLCIVCCETKRSCVLIPCGHSCMCGSCAERVVSEKGMCPVCRGAVVMVQPVFES